MTEPSSEASLPTWMLVQDSASSSAAGAASWGVRAGTENEPVTSRRITAGMMSRRYLQKDVFMVLLPVQCMVWCR